MLCILGPTASGKSSLAMTLAQHDPRIEIISMDSALVYKGMDIGTAKPSAQDRLAVTHHLLDLITPSETYSAARFVRDAQAACETIRSQQKIPLLVGGTMLYFKAYVDGLDDLPSVPATIRDSIKMRAAVQGWPALHRELAQIDPNTAARLKPTDAQRISRAIELFEYTGQTMSALIAQSAPRSRPGPGRREALKVIVLEPTDRSVLHTRIAQRFDQMIKDGFLDEVARLMAAGNLRPDHPSMRCVGYRQAWEHLAGRTNTREFREAGLAATRQLAKRQLTWIRRLESVVRIDPFSQENSSGLPQLCESLVR